MTFQEKFCDFVLSFYLFFKQINKKHFGILIFWNLTVFKMNLSDFEIWSAFFLYYFQHDEAEYNSILGTNKLCLKDNLLFFLVQILVTSLNQRLSMAYFA